MGLMNWLPVLPSLLCPRPGEMCAHTCPGALTRTQPHADGAWQGNRISELC